MENIDEAISKIEKLKTLLVEVHELLGKLNLDETSSAEKAEEVNCSDLYNSDKLASVKIIDGKLYVRNAYQSRYQLISVDSL